MKNFLDAMKSVEGKQYNVTDKGRIQQKEQLELKTLLTESLLKDFVEAGVEVVEVPKGFVIVVPNDEEGAIPLELSIVTKPLDYDYDALHDEWSAKQEKLKKE